MPSSLIITFRQQFPEGSILSELLTINDGLFVVKVSIVVRELSLSQALAANSTLELAEDIACNRALERLALEATPAKSLTHDTSFADGSDADPKPAPAGSGLLTPSVEETTSSPEPAQPPNLKFGSEIVPGRDISTLKPGSVVQTPNPQPPNNGTAAANPSSPGTPSREYPELKLAVPPTLPRPPMEPIIEAEDVQPDFREPPQDLNPISADPIDLSDIIAQTDVELQRLRWDIHQGREFLEQAYGKRSRHDLTDEELLEFLLYLESQPTPQVN